MLKHFLTLAFCALISLGAMAVPAKRVPTVVTQPDGTQLTIVLTGDESFHCYRTLDGVALAQRADGGYCYAVLDGEILKAGTMLAHNLEVRDSEERNYIIKSVATSDQLSEIASQRLALRNELRVERMNSRMAKAPAKVGEMGSVTGQRKGLVLLVNFKDKSMRSNNTREAFDDMFNKEGYTGNGNNGSVHDYFYDQSYGKFDLTFDVIGPVTVSERMSYYGGNNYLGSDSNPAAMVYEACKLADDEVNFADYDWDGDGEVDQVFVIYAGYSEAVGASSDCIWPHEWTLTSANLKLTLDGVKIDTYGCSSELTGTSGTKMDGVGTACHEFSHCMGLPDLYDTSDTGTNYGMDIWSLMDYGCYGGDGYRPVGYTSYERMVSGWLEPTVLNEPATITGMKSLMDKEEAYIIYNDKYDAEYFLLENRQLTSWDKSLPNSGMLVIHVDYDAISWASNVVNNTKNRQRCTVIAADNSYYGKNAYSGNNADGDPYPGTSGNTQLTDTSKPAAALYRYNTDNRKFMGKPITNIAEDYKTGDVSFDFMGGASEPSAISDATTLAPNVPVTVYSPDGRKVTTATYSTWRNGLPAGAYLLKPAGGKTVKAICQ